MINFNTLNFQNNNKTKEFFSLSEESIIDKFTTDKINKYTHEYNIKQTPQVEKIETAELNNMRSVPTQRTMICRENYQTEDNGYERGNITENYSTEHLINKIRNLENEKKHLMKYLEDKTDQEMEYKRALETQVAIVNCENKKSEFYEKEWLKMRSMQYQLMNSGKTPLRHLLENYYKDTNLYEKIGNLTRTQETFVANLIEDHKNLLAEKKNIDKKYQDAVDSNFQLYQQNEMLKAQNTHLLEKNQVKIDQELKNKLKALNVSLMHVQKENIEMKDILDQYSRLIGNIKQCSEINEIMSEIDKFGNYLSI